MELELEETILLPCSNGLRVLDFNARTLPLLLLPPTPSASSTPSPMPELAVDPPVESGINLKSPLLLITCTNEPEDAEPDLLLRDPDLDLARSAAINPSFINGAVGYETNPDGPFVGAANNLLGPADKEDVIDADLVDGVNLA